MYDDVRNETNTAYCPECGCLVDETADGYCDSCGAATCGVDRCQVCGELKWDERTLCEDCEDRYYRDFTKFARENHWDSNKELLEILEAVVYDKEF